MTILFAIYVSGFLATLIGIPLALATLRGDLAARWTPDLAGRLIVASLLWFVVWPFAIAAEL